MRRFELVNLCLPDIDGERGTVLIRSGKGSKDRLIPIGERALGWIDHYVQNVRPSLAADKSGDVLFLTFMSDPFSPKSMSHLVRQYVKTAGVSKSGSCHLFRHTMATLMLDSGADIRHIQAMLGHAQLNTTQIYTQVSIRKLKEIHDKTHPAKKKRDDKPTEDDGDTAK